jgi:hypothetical protein
MKKLLADIGFGILLALMLGMIIMFAGVSDVFIYNNF